MPDEAPVISVTGLASTASTPPALAGLSISMGHSTQQPKPPRSAHTTPRGSPYFTFAGVMSLPGIADMQIRLAAPSFDFANVSSEIAVTQQAPATEVSREFFPYKGSCGWRSLCLRCSGNGGGAAFGRPRWLLGAAGAAACEAPPRGAGRCFCTPPTRGN